MGENIGMALAHLPVAMCVYRRHRQISPIRNQRGFTLIEVMIAVAIVGILGMVAVPNFIQWNARYQLKQATTELAGSLNLARMAAMNRNLAVTVTLALVPGKVNVDFGGALAPILLPQSIIAFTGGPTIQFTQQGLSGSAANQTLTLVSQQGTTYSLLITPAGKVNWCAKTTCP
jgi:prepilin-type N-terminal cleavage/methylation domain-containing protein